MVTSGFRHHNDCSKVCVCFWNMILLESEVNENKYEWVNLIRLFLSVSKNLGIFVYLVVLLDLEVLSSKDMLGQDQSIQAKKHHFKMFYNSLVISRQNYESNNESYSMTYRKFRPSSTKSFGLGLKPVLMSFLSLECVYKIITLLGGCLRFLIWRKIIIWRIFDILFDQNIFTSLNKKYFQKLNFKK